MQPLKSEHEPNMFEAALRDVASGPMVGSYTSLTKQLMMRLAEKGCTLEHLADRRMMNRSLSTLKRRAREFEIAFPDYVPMRLRKKETVEGKA